MIVERDKHWTDFLNGAAPSYKPAAGKSMRLHKEWRTQEDRLIRRALRHGFHESEIYKAMTSTGYNGTFQQFMDMCKNANARARAHTR